MTVPFATDWVELLLAPVWAAIFALLLLGFVIVFREPLGRLLGRLGITPVGLFGIDIEWIADRTADAYRQHDLAIPSGSHLRAFSVLSARLAPLARDRRLLWVDDRPQGNAAEAKLLRRMGVEIVSVTSTQDALMRLSSESAPFDLVISDWDRGGGEDALDLALQMKANGLAIPIVVYTEARSPERLARAAEAGITAVLTEPDDLLKQVLVELALS